MNNKKLSKEWRIEKLSNLISCLESGKRPKGGVQGIEYGVPSIGAEHLNNEGSFKFHKIKYVPEDFALKMKKGIIKESDIIVVKDGATTAKTSYVSKSFPFKFSVINEHVFILRTKEILLPKFAFYKLFSAEGNKEILLDFRGAAQGGISSKFIEKVNIPLPPLETQHAIVSKIEELFSELDKGIAELKTAQQQLKTYRQSVLKSAFEGKLTNEWRKNGNDKRTANELINIIQTEKENEASRIGKKLKPTNSLTSEEISQLSDLPLGWKWVSLGEIISDLTDYHANGSYAKIKENVELLDKPNYAIMIRATNFEKNNFTKDLKYITEDAYNYMSRSKLFGGEILIGKIGNAGKVYYMPKLNRPSSLAMNLFALKFNVDINKYIHYHLLSSFSKQEISKYVKGVGNPTIDKNSIRSLSIALPSFQEQHQIVQEIESRLSVADKMEQSIQESLQKAEALRQSILKKAFSGELV